MKRLALVTIAGVAICAMSAGAAVVPSPVVTPPGGIARGAVKLSKVEGKKTATPIYSVQNTQPPAQAVQRQWYQITVFFHTTPEWLDDLDLRCYVLLKGKPGTAGSKQMLLKGDVTLVNIAKGKHKCDFFVHPNTLLRYGDVDTVAVVMSKQDQLIGMASQPENPKRWWEDYQPVPGLVLRRTETPFALVNFDDYEQVKDTTSAVAR